jgi:hypothetical protein
LASAAARTRAASILDDIAEIAPVRLLVGKHLGERGGKRVYVSSSDVGIRF